MNNSIAQWCGIVVAIVIAAIGALGHPTEQKVGNTTASFWDAAGGYRISGVVIHSNSVLKTPTAGGTLTVTTSNSATSTASLGCIQTTATSTATPIKFVMQATTTQGIAGQVAANVGNFVVLGQYGNCP